MKHDQYLCDNSRECHSSDDIKIPCLVQCFPRSNLVAQRREVCFVEYWKHIWTFPLGMDDCFLLQLSACILPCSDSRHKRRRTVWKFLCPFQSCCRIEPSNAISTGMNIKAKHSVFSCETQSCTVAICHIYQTAFWSNSLQVCKPLALLPFLPFPCSLNHSFPPCSQSPIPHSLPYVH